jgi:small subunit ribosomal protein S33
MALANWFAKTRKFAAVPQNPSNLPKLESRTLEKLEQASSRIFGHFQNANPGKRTGRDRLRQHLRGDAVVRWYQPHLRTRPGLWFWKSEQERYALAKTSYLRTKGKIPPKKGAGKKALKRMADAKKAAAKAAKTK